MQFWTQALLSGLALTGSAFAQNSSSQVSCPNPIVDIFHSCNCPPGTEFQISTTYGILGVNAADFNNYTSSFYDLSWLGINNITRSGPDYVPGSLRTFSVETAEGTVTFVETLNSYETLPDGSYIQVTSQWNIPLPFPSGNGTFDGNWITIDAEYIAPYETQLKWTVYACFTGHPVNYGEVHIASLKGLLAEMDQAGLVKGNTTGPYYIQDY